MTDAVRLAVALDGRYTIERELGAGGMATVYLARDLKHNRHVALKLLHADLAQTVGAERFLREIQLAAKLSHPHILPLFDSGDAKGLLYYVMPNVDGQSLRDRLSRERQLAVDEAVRIAGEVAGALDYAHRHGVVHRDIKPENIMLQDGHALVADFGIGKALSDVEGQAFTQTGVSVGTPAYMSPEQAAGESVDGRSDLYSLGCVLYEMLVGEQPFTGPTVQAVIAKRFVQTPADVSALREGVPRPLARAIQQVLARTPIDRYHTGADLAAAMRAPDTPVAAASRPAAPEKSIAVLPFASMSTDPENEFFADGITEEILNALSQIAELRVAGRSSSFSFKGKNQDLRQIGEALNVRTVLEGSVRRAGNRVRITAQLVDVTDGFHLWSERYDREIADVFAVQDEIAAAIAAKLKTTLAAGAEARAQRATENIEAYQAYLKGRALLYRRGPSTKLGMKLMEKALELDPTYALAWAGLADANSLLGYYGNTPPEVAAAKAREAVTEALRHGPDLAEAHTARGLQALLFEWDWATAEQSFRKALELNPGYIQATAWYELFYHGFACGRWSEALVALKECQARDPRSAYVATIVAICYAGYSSDPEMERWIELAEQLDPDAFLTLWARQLVMTSMLDVARGVEAGNVALAASGRHVFPLLMLGLFLATTGDIEGARALYDEACARQRREYVPPTALALLEASLGDKEQALVHCRQAIAMRDPQFIIFSLGWPNTNALRAYPEHMEMLKEIGLPGALNG
ncbi:MAG TPA: protein kinase [Gemmatimonadales bacterium]|nr:protein kinase [Gemmatimonadales bacterium]